MLNRAYPATPLHAESAASYQQDTSPIDVGTLTAIGLRHALLIIVIFLMSLAGSAAYLLLAKPIYTASAYLLLDTRKMQLFQQQSLIQDTSFDTPAVESQMEVIRSETIAASVIEDMRLAEDPEFVGGATNLFTTVSRAARNLVRGGRAGEPAVSGSIEERTQRAIARFRTNVRVQRVRTTYVIEIGFSSLDASKAGRIANAVAEAYILDQTQTRQYTTRRATNWLQERMTELRDQAILADRTVQDFRTKNNLVRLGATLVTEQQVAELQSQVSRAREATAEARSRLERIQQIMTSKVPDASMTAWLQNEIINRLRQQYADATRREAEYIVRLGPDHLAVQNARKELRQIERSASEELRRIANGFKSEFDTALGREQQAEARLRDALAENAGSRQEQGAVQVLESSARTYQSLYDAFLQRFTEASAQQNFTSTEARIITPASNGRQIYPNPQQALGLGGVLGLLLGCGAAYIRERLDHVFRTPRQLEQALGVACLGVLPELEIRRPSKRPAEGNPNPAGRSIHQDVGIARQVVLTPFSRFTETIRSVKVAIDTSGIDIKVVGFVSAVPGEGKSTTSSNFAQLAAFGGKRTLLIDADMRRPSLTRQMAPRASAGLVEVLRGKIPLAGAVWNDPVTGLDFLPAYLAEPVAHVSEMLASRAMADLITMARERYDCVVLDFPPLAPVVDAKAASHLVDGFVLVVQWGQTSPEAVTEALGACDVVQRKLVGAILNKANSSALKRIESYKGKKYLRYYSGYVAAAEG